MTAGHWQMLFFILAFFCFLLSFFNAPGPKGGWLALGLAFLTLGLMVPVAAAL